MERNSTPTTTPHVLPGRFKVWLANVNGSKDEIENLREQFYVTLRASFRRIEAHSEAGIAANPAYTHAQTLLAPGRRPRWSDCYEVEQLMVQLFDDVTLRTELEVRLLEAKGTLRPSQYEYYSIQASQPEIDTERRRALLSRLVNDLQWRHTVLEGKRRFSKSLTTRTGIAFLLALAAFGALAAFTHVTSTEYRSGDLRLLGAAGVTGTWGATFSMVTGLQQRIERSAIYDLHVMRAVTMVAARALVGAGAACILFLFFSSGLVSGAIFPDLSGALEGVACRGDQLSICMSRPSIALLVVWCFIAGFSEKLVTNLLETTESKLRTESAKYLPTEPSPVPKPEKPMERARSSGVDGGTKH